MAVAEGDRHQAIATTTVLTVHPLAALVVDGPFNTGDALHLGGSVALIAAGADTLKFLAADAGGRRLDGAFGLHGGDAEEGEAQGDGAHEGSHDPTPTQGG